MTTNGTAALNGASPIGDSSAAPSAVLVLPVGHSAFRRLVELAEREGVDVTSLSLSLLMFGLGQRFVRAPVSPSNAVQVVAVCLSCGRERLDPREPRCPTCRGSWTTAVR